jgi:hypothetical protein
MDFSGYDEQGQPMYRATDIGPQCTKCDGFDGFHADGCQNAEA